MRELNITTREEGQRLDKILSKYLNKAPKSFVYKMLRKKNIKLNGKKATGNEKLSQGDQVCIYLAEDTINKFREEVKAGKQKIKLDVLYEDENVIMVNKPWGILSQKSKPEDISINDQIIPYAVNQGLISEKELQVVKPSICNRLDRNTTGIIICGISIEGLQTMAEMLKHRDMEKYYLCGLRDDMYRDEKGCHIKGAVAYEADGDTYIVVPKYYKTDASRGYAGAHVSLENVGLDIDTVKIRL